MLNHAPPLALLLSGLAGCSALDTLLGKDALPEKIQGQWEVLQIETEGGLIDAADVIHQQYPKCLWGRMTFQFDEGHVAIGYDVLCPTDSGEFYGCEVSARVPAAWDAEKGQWHVDDPVRARSRTVGRSEDALAVPTSCQVTLQEGDYPVVKVRNRDWRWEMQSPDKTSVYRLTHPSSERPDFVAAISALPVPEAPGPSGSAGDAPPTDPVPAAAAGEEVR